MPEPPKMYSVHLPAETKGPRRRKVDMGARGVYRFDADVTDKAVAGYPHHRMKLTAEQAKQFQGDGFEVRELKDPETKPDGAAAELAAAVATERAKDRAKE